MYPALSALQALGNQASQVLWVGGEAGMEAELVARYHIPYTAIPAAGVHGVGITRLPGNLIKLARGVARARNIIRDFEPDVLLFTGGYLAVPMAVAGRKVKSLLYVPDIEPGMALKALARFADVIALTAEDSRKFFKTGQNMQVTGYPTRADLVCENRVEAMEHFHLQPGLPVLLVIGGSKGAHTINLAVKENLPDLLEICQVVHITGKPDFEELQQFSYSLSPELAQRYHPYPYLYEEISKAFSCADLAISRAGASTLGEFPLFGLPAILVPYPYAWRYQKVNADYLVNQGTALTIENQDLSRDLLPAVQNLLSDKDKLAEMKARMSALSTPGAAKYIANLLLALAQEERNR